MLLAAVFVLFFLALCGSVVYGVFILYPLLLGLLSVGFVAWSRGYAIGTILRMGYTERSSRSSWSRSSSTSEL